MTTAMIWGAGGGIGRALVDAMNERNWTVVAVSRDEEALRDIVACSLSADVADAFSVQRAVRAAGLEVSDIDLWIYCAGDITAAPVEDMDPAVWNRILSANLTGAYLTSHYSLPLLAPNAHLMFVGAISERLRLPGLSAYGAAKAGLEAFAEALRKEQRPRRVTVVRPSAVATPLWDKVPLRMPRDAAPPSKVAARILAAYDEGHTGTLDLV